MRTMSAAARLHDGLCVFQSAFWHAAEQYQERRQMEQVLGAGLLQPAAEHVKTTGSILVLASSAREKSFSTLGCCRASVTGVMILLGQLAALSSLGERAAIDWSSSVESAPAWTRHSITSRRADMTASMSGAMPKRFRTLGSPPYWGSIEAI